MTGTPYDIDELLSLLKRGHILYRGAGEWAQLARTLRTAFFALEEISRRGSGLRRYEFLREQARRGQLDILTHLQAINAMLDDPSLQWFMKSGFLD